MTISRNLDSSGRGFAQAVVVCLSLLGALLFSASASAEAPAPGFAIIGKSTPTELQPGGEGVITLFYGDLGAAPIAGSMQITATLPEGLTATEAGVGKGLHELQGKCEVVDGTSVTCRGTPSVPYYPEEWGTAWIRVKVGARVPGGAVATVSINGGGALEPASTTVPISVGESGPGPGINHFSAWLSNENGTPDTQAGSHPYDMEVAFALNDELVRPLPTSGGQNLLGLEHPAGGRAATIIVNLPPGLVGDPQAVPRCPREYLDRDEAGPVTELECPLDTEVGFNSADIEGGALAAKADVYNMAPPPGVAAQFAFIQSGTIVFLDSGVRTGVDNGVTTHAIKLPRRNITFNRTTIWGVPAAASHDTARCLNYGAGDVLPECEDHDPQLPLLTLPTSCAAPLEFSAELAGTWEEGSLTTPLVPAFTRSSSGEAIGLSGCERLQPFKPSISIAPDTVYADTPAGLSVGVSMPEGLNPEGLSTPNLKDTKVVLPQGVVINPGQATGLQACQPSQEALGREPNGEVNEQAPSCPAASKVGTVEIETPTLRNKMTGNVFILQKNPPDLELMIAASADGVNLKLVGQVHLDEQTGRLTTTFDETPDLPFTNFKLNFSGGAQAALATPTGCGTYESTADFTPWSTPYIEDALDSSRFQITSGPNGSACPSPMPFTPTMTAGATTDQAGGYTDFTMLLQRGDEQQRIKTLSFKTPEGLLGMIAKVPLCGEPQAAQGTCSAASQIGHTVVGTGPGPFPFYIPQASAPPAPIYLTGPYKGAPFGLSIVVPLIAGPFNLGTEIVRAAITVDPRTSQITVTTDPLPQVVKGIPTDLRSIDAVIDRPEFMFNPTDCNPMSFSGTATSNEGAIAPLASHFQMGSCQALKFQPNFKVSTSGKTSRKNGASLTARIVYPTGSLGANQASSQANIAKVKVDLPKQLPSRLTTLQKACPAATFEANPANCPPASIVGHAKAVTPVLPVALEGPAYFVSHGGAKFPELIIVLQGYGVTVQLHSETFISKAGITSSTFREVPDVPVGTFELTLPEGPDSALAANGNLCKTKLTMPTAFTAQNGAVIHQSTPIGVTGCAKHVRHVHKK